MKHGIQIGQAINPLCSCGDDLDLAAGDSPPDDGAQQVISRRFEFWTDRLRVSETLCSCRTKQLLPGVLGPPVNQL